MSRGLVKAKKYDWKDSNLALFGSDTEKEVKKESAEQEPAWQGAGQEPGLKVWRIENFEVKDWPEDDYGEFFNGDSYIILNTYKDEETEELNYDVHFWIGKNSSQDEYGTAAYKTVELDTLLDDKPVQHREVQGHESKLFKSYFPKGLQMMEGGAKSGFREVPPEEYISRLLRFFKDKSGAVRIKEVSETKLASQYLARVSSKRGDADTEVLDEDGTSSGHDFFGFLDEEPSDEADSDDEDADGDKKLLRVWRVVLDAGFLRVCPVQPHFLRRICLATGF
nr:hypothetical protein BaRGS_028144 [Batillaria attramentaria]